MIGFSGTDELGLCNASANLVPRLLLVQTAENKWDDSKGELSLESKVLLFTDLLVSNLQFLGEFDTQRVTICCFFMPKCVAASDGGLLPRHGVVTSPVADLQLSGIGVIMPLPAHGTSADHPVVPCNAQFRCARSPFDSAMGRLQASPFSNRSSFLTLRAR
jgi:hypothetical protein